MESLVGIFYSSLFGGRFILLCINVVVLHIIFVVTEEKKNYAMGDENIVTVVMK